MKRLVSVVAVCLLFAASLPVAQAGWDDCPVRKFLKKHKKAKKVVNKAAINELLDLAQELADQGDRKGSCRALTAAKKFTGGSRKQKRKIQKKKEEFKARFRAEKEAAKAAKKAEKEARKRAKQQAKARKKSEKAAKTKALPPGAGGVLPAGADGPPIDAGLAIRQTVRARDEAAAALDRSAVRELSQHAVALDAAGDADGAERARREAERIAAELEQAGSEPEPQRVEGDGERSGAGRPAPGGVEPGDGDSEDGDSGDWSGDGDSGDEAVECDD
jgi:hypothetical protein